MIQDMKIISLSAIIGIGMLYQAYNAGQFWHSLTTFQAFGIWFSMIFALLPEIAGTIIAAWRPTGRETYIKWVALVMIFSLALISGSIGHIRGIVSATELSETDRIKIELAQKRISAAEVKSGIATDKAKTLEVSKEYITRDTSRKVSAQDQAIKAASDIKSEVVKLENLVLKIESDPNPKRLLKCVEAVTVLAGFSLLQILIWILSFLGFAENVSHRTIAKKNVQNIEKTTQNCQNEQQDQTAILTHFDNFSEVEKNVLRFFSSRTEAIKWSQLCSRKLSDNSEQLESALNSLMAKGLIIFNKPSETRGTWTVKGV